MQHRGYVVVSRLVVVAFGATVLGACGLESGGTMDSETGSASTSPPGADGARFDAAARDPVVPPRPRIPEPPDVPENDADGGVVADAAGDAAGDAR